MHRLRVRAMSLAWLVFSVAYLLFTFTIEERRMPGGVWDPGSTALPAAVAALMVGCSLYLIAKDLRESVRKGPERGRPRETDRAAPGEDGRGEGSLPPDRRRLTATARLIAVTVIILVSYVLSFRAVGYVIATTVMMFALTYFYELGDVRASLIPRLVRVGFATAVSTAAVFYIGVIALRWTRYFGRVWEIALLRNRAFSALLGLVLWAALLWPIFAFLTNRYSTRRRPEPRSAEDGRQHAAAARAFVVAVSTTLLLYLVFQQLFRVSLPAGVLV